MNPLHFGYGFRPQYRRRLATNKIEVSKKDNEPSLKNLPPSNENDDEAAGYPGSEYIDKTGVVVNIEEIDPPVVSLWGNPTTEKHVRDTKIEGKRRRNDR